MRLSSWAVAGVLAVVSARAQTPVWIDTDPSVARGGHEIDDGFALIQAFHSNEIVVRGVSVVFGNAPLQTALPIARELLRLLNPSGPKPYAGASGAAQLGQPTAASRALAAALRKGKLTILALGPATNVATVLKTHPELASRIERIVAVAGRRPDQKFLVGTFRDGTSKRPLRDFNFEMDPDAFQTILDSRVPLVLAPFEISSKVWITAKDLEALKGHGPVLDWLVGPAVDWLEVWKTSFGVDGFNPFDTLAVAVVTSPQLVSCETLPARIETLPDDTGSPTPKAYLLLSSKIESAHAASYCYEAKPEFKADLLRRLLN